MQPVPTAVPEDVPLSGVISRLANEHKDALPVVDRESHYRGAVTTSEAEVAARENALDSRAGELSKVVPVLHPDQSLSDALNTVVAGAIRPTRARTGR
jgi:CBS domain-containing protein